MIQKFKSKLVKKEKLNHSVYLFEFELIDPKLLEFLPGQFLNLFVDRLIVRAYSISGYRIVEGVAFVELIIEFVPNGRASTYLEKSQIGTEFTFSAPLGKFHLSDNIEYRNIILIATGTGIAPMKAITTYLFQTQKINDINALSLYHGLRYEEDIYLSDYFRNFEKVNKKFFYNLFLSKSSDNYVGNKGHVQTGLDKIVQEVFESSQIFICGNKNTVLDIVQYCKDRKVPENQIHFERFN